MGRKNKRPILICWYLRRDNFSTFLNKAEKRKGCNARGMLRGVVGKKMKILNIVGLIMNITGSILVACSFGRHIGEAYNENDKGEKIYLTSFLHPKMFNIGITLLVLGFILQIIYSIIV